MEVNELILAAIVTAGAGGFEGPVPGVELVADHRHVRAEVTAYSIDKLDGGRGYQVSGTLLAHHAGVRVSHAKWGDYERTDLWLVTDWGPTRMEFEPEGGALSFQLRPELALGHVYLRPQIGYLWGRGANGFTYGLAGGIRFGKADVRQMDR